MNSNSQRNNREVSFSRVTDKAANTFDSSTLSSREDRIRVDPVIHLKQLIAELQEENASLRADIAFKAAEFEKSLQQIKANSLELNKTHNCELND